MAEAEAAKEFPEIFRARKAFANGKTKSIQFRREQLLRLQKLIHAPENEEQICAALYKDMKRSSFHATTLEIVFVKSEVDRMICNLASYLSVQHCPFNILAVTDKSYVSLEPHGVVVILGAWNYPIFNTLIPLIGSIAAGNCVILKPSEISPHSAQVLAELIPKYLDNDCYHVILGDPKRTIKMLENKFDYIFFTGSSNIGRSVLQSAAKHLTPVTLELGGKSPVYIDDSAVSKMAVKRILWGKLVNHGQLCVAPDYILCTKTAEEAFIKFSKEIFTEWYGGLDKLKEWPDFSRIINSNHFNRLKRMLETTEGTIVLGGETVEEELWIEPTLVVNVKPGDSLLNEEIFGPILPFVTVASPEQAVEVMLAGSRPLALYIFSKDEKITQMILDSVPSGTVCVNDTLFQVADMRLPFGGTGDSGFGSFRGKYSVETFSHKRSVLVRGLNYFSEKMGELRYPPYSDTKKRISEIFMAYKTVFDISPGPLWTHGLAFSLGCVISHLFF